MFEQLAREDYLQLRQEAMDLQEYSSAKLDRVTRYLGVLADKTRKLGKVCPLTFVCRLLAIPKFVCVINFSQNCSMNNCNISQCFLGCFIVIVVFFVYNELIPTITMTFSNAS